MDFSDLVALKIKELMQEQNITIAMFLTRKTKTIRLENLLYICEGLGTNLSEFFADERFKDAEAKEWTKKKSN